jgi:hypothetical protein
MPSCILYCRLSSGPADRAAQEIGAERGEGGALAVSLPQPGPSAAMRRPRYATLHEVGGDGCEIIVRQPFAPRCKFPAITARTAKSVLAPSLRPADRAAQEIVAQRGEGGALGIVLALAVTAGGGLVKIGLITHRPQLCGHLAAWPGWTWSSRRLVANRIGG